MTERKAEVIGRMLTEYNEAEQRQLDREEGQDVLLKAIQALKSGLSDSQILQSGIDQNTLHNAKIAIG